MANPLNIVDVVNRTTRPLEVMHDGVPWVIPPGYRFAEGGKVVGAGRDGEPYAEKLPGAVAEFAKRQNPQPGTADFEVPNEFDTKIGVAAWGDDISYLPDPDTDELLDRSLLDDEAQEAVKVETRVGRKIRKKQRRKRYTDAKLKDPAGIKADYPD